jgi:hypothetical protein
MRRRPRAKANTVDSARLAPIDAPELTILSALDHVLELAGFSIVAAHPELASEPSRFRPLDTQAALAEQVVQDAARLAKSIARYRAATLASLASVATDEQTAF